MPYTVKFEYDYEDSEVTGPLEAAMLAYDTITSPESMRPIATVTMPSGITEDIDLEVEGS